MKQVISERDDSDNEEYFISLEYILIIYFGCTVHSQARKY